MPSRACMQLFLCLGGLTGTRREKRGRLPSLDSSIDVTDLTKCACTANPSDDWTAFLRWSGFLLFLRSPRTTRCSVRTAWQQFTGKRRRGVFSQFSPNKRIPVSYANNILNIEPEDICTHMKNYPPVNSASPLATCGS